MDNKNHLLNEDYPLSGGKEPDFKYPKTVLIIMAILIIGIATIIAHTQGLF